MKMKILIVLSLMVSAQLLAQQVQPKTQADIDSEIANRNADTRMKNATAASLEKTTANEVSAGIKLKKSEECEAYKKKKIEKLTSDIHANANEGLDGNMGTPTMQACVKLSRGAMRYLHGNNKRPVTWKSILEANDACMEINDESHCIIKDADQKAEKTIACENAKKLAARCDAAAFIISTFDRDWENPEHVVTKEVKGGNPAITCKGQGIATVDYEGCVKFVQNGDLMDMAQGAVQQGQALYYQDKTTTAQMEASQNPNSATASLEALKTGVKSQQDIATQRAAMDTGKLAALATYYFDIPTHDTLIEKCLGYKPPEGITSDACKSVAAQPDFGFLMNQEARDKMKGKLVKVGVDVGSDAMMAALMAKRVGSINDTIAKVDAFKPIDPTMPTGDNLQTTFCQTNPGDPKCLTGGLDRTFDAMGDNVISFGDGGTGVAYSATKPTTDPGAAAIAAGATDKTSITPVGSIISGAQQNSGLVDPFGAATITKGTAPTAGGGGGGGSGGGSGGGGGATPGAQPQGGVSAAIQGKTPSYGGGSGTFSMMGGFGINKSKSVAKDEGNPFGKLFGDKSKSGAINFRDPASASNVGTKGDNIFEMISKRYSTVNSDKRLLEYELAK